MQSVQYQPDLDHLLHISHVLGCNEGLVQAGGGNTSVKRADGKTMLVKASGTPLNAVSTEQGWVAVGMDRIHQLLGDNSLRTCAAAEREKRVLDALYAAVIEPADARPSVETPLHVLLDAVVMHSHPVTANALACHPDGEGILAELFADERQRPPLWVPYVDPGATLAFEVGNCIADYHKRFSSRPDVLLLENHGLFVAARSPGECVAKHTHVLTRIEQHFVGSRESPVDDATAKRISDAVHGVFSDTLLVRFSRHDELQRAARGEYANVFAGALSPDHVVYTGPRALTVEPDARSGQLEEALRGFEQRYGLFPRLLLVRGMTMCIVGETEKKLGSAEALALSAVQMASLSGGAVRFLSEEHTEFIMNWEAEHYRAKQQ